MNRADRRRLRKADETHVERGLDIERRDASQLVSLMRVLHDRVRQSVKAGTCNPLLDYVFANMDSTARALRGVAIACRSGCYHCCQIWVGALAPEVFHALGPIRDSPGVRQSVAAAYANTAGKTFDDRAKMITPCPLLVDTKCSIYARRPIMCRTASSFDAQICERSYSHLSGENIPTSGAFLTMRSGYCIAIAGALKAAGLIYQMYELNGALRVALRC